jgi:DNA-binding CsgD family transcriptional regulator
MPFDTDWFEGCGDLIQALNGPDFASICTAQLRRLVPVDTVMVTIYFDDAPPKDVYYEQDPEHVAYVTEDYTNGPYRLDPFYVAFEERRPNGVYRLRDLAPDGFYRSTYYKTYYYKVHVTDEVALLQHLTDTSGVVFSIARRRGMPRYTKAHLSRLSETFPMFGAAMARQWRSIGPEPDGRWKSEIMNDHYRRFGEGELSEREREIVRLILAGHSTLSISRLLDISEGTVKVHRKHTYAKLGISSQAELFARFMETLPLR